MHANHKSKKQLNGGPITSKSDAKGYLEHQKVTPMGPDQVWRVGSDEYMTSWEWEVL